MTEQLGLFAPAAVMRREPPRPAERPAPRCARVPGPLCHDADKLGCPGKARCEELGAEEEARLRAGYIPPDRLQVADPATNSGADSATVQSSGQSAPDRGCTSEKCSACTRTRCGYCGHCLERQPEGDWACPRCRPLLAKVENSVESFARFNRQAEKMYPLKPEPAATVQPDVERLMQEIPAPDLREIVAAERVCSYDARQPCRVCGTPTLAVYAAGLRPPELAGPHCNRCADEILRRSDG